MRHLRPLHAAAFVGAFALVGAVLMPTAAQAAPGDDVLVFSNGAVVDTLFAGVDGGEYEWISAAITAAGYDVTSFDGGDGQAATWTTALSGIEVFVLPEQEVGAFYDPDNPPAWLSAAAMGVLIDWVQAGGTMLVSGSCQEHQAATGYLLSEAVGVDYDDVLGGYDVDDDSCIEAGQSTRWIDDSGLPDDLGYADGDYGMMLEAFSDEQLAPLTVWYSSDECSSEMLTVGEFTAGSGRIAFEAWDYFNDTGADQTVWNEVLASLLNGNSAVSNWQPGGVAPAPITATTASGQKLFTIGEEQENGCGDDGDDGDNRLFRVNPGTGDAAPIGSDSLDGRVGQGATDPTTGIAYVPFDDDDDGDPVLYTIDTVSGAFTEVGEFSGTFEEANRVYSIAIAADGSAYAFANVEDGDDDVLGFYSLDLSDATLTLISEIEQVTLDDPYAFAYNPENAKFYVFDRGGHDFFEINVATGALTGLGELAGASLDEESYVLALQIDSSGTFWVAYDVPFDEEEDWQSMLSKFTLADIGGGDVQAHEVGFLIDDPIYTYSLLLSAPAPQLAATGVDSAGVAGVTLGGGILLLLGLGFRLLAVRRRRTS